MKEKSIVTKGHWIGFLCCSLLPLAALVFGIVLLWKGFVINLSFGICFIALPLIAIVLQAWCIFSGCPFPDKRLMCCLILAAFLFGFLFCTLFYFPLRGRFDQVRHYKGSKAEQQYSSLEHRNPLMPTVSELGSPIAVEYCHINFHCIFSWERDWLISRYTPEDYEAKKAALEEYYVFQTDPISESGHICAPFITLDGYHFRLLSLEDYKDALDFPKDLILIGYSDDSQEIVYLTFHDIDLDYIDDLGTFITDDCGWKYIR